MEIIGRQCEVGFALEEDRNTAETVAEKWFKNVKVNIVERSEKAIDDATHGRLEDSDGARVVKTWIEGDLEGIVHADAIGYLFYNLYGTVTTQTVTGSIKDHAFSLEQSIQHPTLSIFVKDGDVQQKVFSGGMVTNLQLTAVQDNFVRFKTSFMALEAANNSDTPSYDTEYDFIGRDVVIKLADTEGGLSGASALPAKDLTITWDPGAIMDYVLGSRAPSSIFNAKMSIEGELNLNYEDNTLKDLYLADTYKYLQVVIQGEADIGSNNHPTITLLCNRAQIMDWNRDGGADELVTQPVNFKAFYNATDSEQSTMTLRNLTAEYDVPVSD